MGGKLFELGRTPQEEYVKIEKELLDYLSHKFPVGEGKDVPYRIPRYYRSKPDFGDVDILLSNEVIDDWKTLREDIVKDLGPTDYECKSWLSMAYKNQIQVDFMPIDANLLIPTWQFLCYNDLGNLLGKHYRRFNLKYGEKGLFYVYRRDEGGYKKDIFLTSDMKRILGFLELSFEEWDAGFETLEEMFEWVIACKYFTCVPFRNLTKVTSKRARLRTTMKKFVEYVEEKNIQKAYPFEEKSVYIPKIIEYFPDVPLENLIQQEKELEARANVIKSKFNGKLVMAKYPELKGPSLGKFLAKFKESFDDFEDSIYHLPQDEIIQKLESFYQEYKTNN